MNTFYCTSMFIISFAMLYSAQLPAIAGLAHALVLSCMSAGMVDVLVNHYIRFDRYCIAILTCVSWLLYGVGTYSDHIPDPFRDLCLIVFMVYPGLAVISFCVGRVVQAQCRGHSSLLQPTMHWLLIMSMAIIYVDAMRIGAL